MIPFVTALIVVLLIAVRPARVLASTEITEVKMLTDSVEAYGTLELKVTTRARFANPYDPTQIDLWASFVAPDGSVLEVPGFWSVPYKREASESGSVVPLPDPAGFRVRFTPHQVGEWRCVAKLKTPSGTVSSAESRFHVHASDHKGFLRLPPKGERGFRFDDGSPYYGIGANYGWWRNNPADFDRWLPLLAEHGVNLIRVWMAPWSMSIEWSDTGLGNYDARQGAAAQLDHVLTQADRLGIKVLLVLLNHGQYSRRVNPEWSHNPFNVENGGPLEHPEDFFVDPKAKDLFKQRLRYVVARWGHHTSLLAWELWNEVDLTTAYHADHVAAWHAEMAGYIRSIDPYQHPITTSYSNPRLDAKVWCLPEIDFTTTHFYDPPDIVTAVIETDRGKRSAFGKPTLIGEFGMSYQRMLSDPNGVVLHNGLWAGLFSLGAATPMSWWWDNYIEPGFLYPRFQSLARFLQTTVGGHKLTEDVSVRIAHRADLQETEAPVRALGIQGGEDVVLWLHDTNHTYDGVVAGYEPCNIDDLCVTLDAIPAGTYEATWWDTWKGEVQSTATVALAPGTPLPVPSFQRDIAVRLRLKQ